MNYQKSIVNAEIERVIFRNGANAINQLQQENKQLKEEIKKLKQLNQIVYVDESKKILDELEKWLEEENKKTFIDIVSISAYEKVLNKIKQLKGE